MKKNQKIILTIESYGAFGEGVAHAEGFVIFLPFALVGEVVEAHILSVKKNVAYAKVLSVIEKSKDRREPFCPHFSKCGGCDMQHLSYPAQLEVKKEQVKGCLKRIAKIDGFDITVNPSLKEQKSRNKLTLPFGELNGEAILGFYSERSHRVIKIEDCPLGERVNEIIKIFTGWANKHKISVYNEQSGKGVLRAISVRNYADKFMFTLVASSSTVPHVEVLVQELNQRFDSPVIYLNVNAKNTNVVLGDKNIHLSGEKKLRSEALGVKFELSPFSFAQVNDEVRDKLYSKVLSLVDEGDTVIDAYSGAGLMSVLLSKKARKVYGAEIIPDAVRDADVCAEQNGVKDKVINRVGDCAKLVPEIVREIGHTQDLTVVLDPPRKGCDKAVLDSVTQANPKKIIYVSCNPATLARDLLVMNDKYSIESVDIFDMFPDTKHVETVALLSRKIDVHKMKLNSSPFEMIKSGAKTIELRLFDEKRQQVKAGDKIVFTNNANGEILNTTVVKLHRFDSFKELYKSLPLLKCGYTAENVDKATPSDMEQYYSVEEQNKYGVVGIELCRTKQITDESVVCHTHTFDN